MDKILYSVTGIFEKPEDILIAARKTRDAGYTKFDVNTPYPIHGMDEAMNLPPSRLGYVALTVGLLGVGAALFFMWWVFTINYPQVIGGKPYFTLPAFIPITFEVTVLSASVITVLVMLFILFKLPNNSHPLHDTPYMKKVSSDKYGLNIRAEDPIFNEYMTKEFLANLDAMDISPIYFDDNEINTKHRIFDPKFIIFLIFVSVFNSAAVYFAFNYMLVMPPFNWMDRQPKVIPQDNKIYFESGVSMLMPVKGTVAKGHLPYSYKGDPESAGRLLMNPAFPTKANLQKGQKKYDTFCSPCHGYAGRGESRLRGQFPVPPSLHSDKVRNWSDGRIYHVIMDGQNTMPSYSSQLIEEERWAIINYIRALQRSQNAKESDIQ